MIICACTDNNSYHITVLKSQGPSSIPHVTLLLDDSFTVFDVSLSLLCLKDIQLLLTCPVGVESVVLQLAC